MCGFLGKTAQLALPATVLSIARRSLYAARFVGQPEHFLPLRKFSPSANSIAMLPRQGKSLHFPAVFGAFLRIEQPFASSMKSQLPGCYGAPLP
jgi:hypothetical protein